MRGPRLASVIERRLLVNYRVDPAIAARLLPAPLRPQEINGWAVAGICLIRLGRVRPAWMPGALGVRSENAAHRIAVEWDGPLGRCTGVYIPRRDSDSLVSVAAGGRVFPGRLRRAVFDVRETAEDFAVAFAARDGAARVRVDAHLAGRLSGSALFAGVDEASAFFRDGSVGLSPGRNGVKLDGVELHTGSWRVEPLEIRRVTSSFFDDPERFPRGSATLDCALLMRDLPVTWRPVAAMPTGAAGTGLSTPPGASPARRRRRDPGVGAGRSAAGPSGGFL